MQEQNQALPSLGRRELVSLSILTTILKADWQLEKELQQILFPYDLQPLIEDGIGSHDQLMLMRARKSIPRQRVEHSDLILED